MRRTITLTITALVAAATLTACGGSGDDTEEPASEVTTSEESPAEETPAEEMSTDLATAESSLGTIVVDGNGMTAYYFLKDTKDSGTSACTGGCLTAWPPVLSTAATPTAEGVAGTLGTITTPDGAKQVTLNGLPLYYFAQDKNPGDILGQGVNGVWYLANTAGDMIRTAASGY